MKTLLSDILDENDGADVSHAPAVPENRQNVPSVTDALDRHREILLQAALRRAISEESFVLAQRVLVEITAEDNSGLHKWLWTLILAKVRYEKPVSISWIRKIAANWMRGQAKLKDFNKTMANAAADVAESEREK